MASDVEAFGRPDQDHRCFPCFNSITQHISSYLHWKESPRKISVPRPHAFPWGSYFSFVDTLSLPGPLSLPFLDLLYITHLFFFWRCPWCNCYRRRKWTRRLEFKSWTRLIAFSHSTNTLGKGMNPNILPPAMGK